MRRWLLAGFAFVVASGGAVAQAAASGASLGSAPSAVVAAASPGHAVLSGRVRHESFPKQIVRAGGQRGKAAPLARRQMSRPLVTAPAPVTAKINVTYSGFPAAARVAFQKAVDIWATQVHSTVPIDVAADWSDLDTQYQTTGVLGSAGPTDFVAGFTNAPNPNVFYPVALANALAGSDQLPANWCAAGGGSPDGVEIQASFNSARSDWYFGTDGNPGQSQYDLETVVLHELGHGLGFVGTFDGLDPGAGTDTGKGYFGLSDNGQSPTIFDTFVSTGSGTPLGTAPYTEASTQLGSVLRGSSGGAEWNGPNGKAADGGQRPLLYSPAQWQEGSSFSHLDESTYPAGDANSLMSPMVQAAEAEHAPGPIMLGMFQDMGWPTTGAPTTVAGDYHPYQAFGSARLASATGVSNGAPLTVQVTGRMGVPANATAVAVNVEVKAPTASGYWSALPGCSGGPGRPDTGDFSTAQTRTSLAILPVDDSGRIRVWTSAGSSTVNVDLVGWYSPSGLAYHHLQNQQVAALTNVQASAPLDVSLLGKAGIPASGVSSVVLKARVSASSTAGWLFVGPGGLTSQIPTTAYAKGEMISNFAVVPLSADGKVRLRINAGTATVSLEAVGWYGSAAGQLFHSAGPARYQQPLQGQELTVSGLPQDSQVMLDVHLSNPTASGWLGSAPAGHPTLHGIQEYSAGRPVSGTIITTTDGAGRVRLHLSAGVSTVYVDELGWFAAP